MNSILTTPEEAKRKQREQAAVSNGIGAQAPGNPVASGNQSQAKGIAAPPATIMINGIPHQNLPEQKHPGPLGMMADAAAGTIGHIATAAFTNRAEERLAANRAGLNNDTAEPINPTKPAVSPSEAAIRAKHSEVMNGQQSAADPAALAAQKAKTAKGFGIAGNLPRVTTQPAGTKAPDGRGIAGQRLITNVADGQSVVDDSASALRDQQSNNPYWSPAAQLERMQRRRLMSDADSAITDPNVQASAQKSLGILGNPAENQLRQAQAQGVTAQNESNAVIADLQKKAASGDPKALATLQAMSGKENRPNPLVVPGGEYIDPTDVSGQTKIRAPSAVFDPATGQWHQQPTGADQYIPPADKREIGKTYQTPRGPMIWRGTGWEAHTQSQATQIKADMKAGKITRDEAIRQLQSIGFQ